MGYILPSVRIQDNLQLPSNSYTVNIKEIEVGRGEIRPGMFLCMDPSGDQPCRGNTIEPTACSMWIDAQYQEEAHFKAIPLLMRRR